MARRLQEGPLFSRVAEVSYDPSGGSAWLAELAGARDTPLLVRGVARHIAPELMERWSFELLASRCERAPLASKGRAADGLIEQGDTRTWLPIVPSAYLRELAAAEEADGAPRGGLAPPGSAAAAALSSGERTTVDWSAYAQAGKVQQGYLSHWDLVDLVPACQQELRALHALWPRSSTCFDVAWVGPPNTFTGLHWDYPNNWLTQVRGTKEVLLFMRDQAARLPLSPKYDYGSENCRVDLTRLADGGGGGGGGGDAEAAQLFCETKGLYCRLEPGDCLYIPRRTFHAVNSLSPSISVSSFGHSPAELVSRGLFMVLRDWLHTAGLHNGRPWGSCTCHASSARRPLAGRALLLAATAALAYYSQRRWGTAT
jgi:lysine-specific demethylase 8